MLVEFEIVWDRAWGMEGRIVAMPVVTTELAVDHRVSDEHSGARFLADIAARRQCPHEL